VSSSSPSNGSSSRPILLNSDTDFSHISQNQLTVSAETMPHRMSDSIWPRIIPSVKWYYRLCFTETIFSIHQLFGKHTPW
jgi:hypothetical protein